MRDGGFQGFGRESVFQALSKLILAVCPSWGRGWHNFDMVTLKLQIT